jgi:hypothetical protein
MVAKPSRRLLTVQKERVVPYAFIQSSVRSMWQSEVMTISWEWNHRRICLACSRNDLETVKSLATRRHQLGSTNPLRAMASHLEVMVID